MKGLLKIGLIIFLVYLAYKYYINNYTVEGILQAKKDSDTINSQYTKKAAILKEQERQIEYAKCNGYYTPGVFEWTDVETCKVDVEGYLNGIDWIERAKNS